MDISKLYNMLHLNDLSLPYLLSLFDKCMSNKADPSVFIRTWAWYSINFTRNQANDTLEQHASRYRIPGWLYVDASTQLKKVQDAIHPPWGTPLGSFKILSLMSPSPPPRHTNRGEVSDASKFMA